MRCAIYTRKSADERTGSDFSSLDNQRAYCSAFISSQGGVGWKELPTRYDDRGFSGGSLARPALDRLRTAIANGEIDAVVVYKIDRLSRSLRDFANLVAEFENRGVSFASVTQSFDSSTSMGRLTLNVLLSFAQFERELIGERLRDYSRGSIRRGLWIQGKRPFGYMVVDRRLVPDPVESKTVRLIHRLYGRLQSLRAVCDELNRRRICNRDGTRWTDLILHRLLRNDVYLGRRRHADSVVHQPLITETIRARTLAILEAGRAGRRGRRESKPRLCLLAGILLDDHGRKCSPRGAGLRRTYRYYVDNGYRPEATPRRKRLLVCRVDAAVVEVLDRICGNPANKSRTYGDLQTYVSQWITSVQVDGDLLCVQLHTGAQSKTTVLGMWAGEVVKRWRLQAPDGSVHDFVNLTLWLRTHAELFSARDLALYPSGTCRAALSLTRLRPGSTRQAKDWKGWRWAPSADQ